MKRPGLYPKLSEAVSLRAFREQVLVHHARFGTQLQTPGGQQEVLTHMDGQHSIEQLESMLVSARGKIAYQELALLLYRLWDRGMLENEEEVRAELFPHQHHRTLERAMAWRRVRVMFGWSKDLSFFQRLLLGLAPVGRFVTSNMFFGFCVGLLLSGLYCVFAGALVLPEALFIEASSAGRRATGVDLQALCWVYLAAVLVLTARGLVRASVLAGPGHGLKSAGVRWSAGVFYLDVDDREAFHMSNELNTRFGLAGLLTPAMLGGLFALVGVLGDLPMMSTWVFTAWLILFLDLCPFLPTDGARLLELATAVPRQRFRVRTYISKKLVRGLIHEGGPGTSGFRVVATFWILWFFGALKVFSDFFLGQIRPLQLSLLGNGTGLETGVGAFLFVYLSLLVLTLLLVATWFVVSFALQVFASERADAPVKHRDSSRLDTSERAQVISTLADVAMLRDVSEETLHKVVEHMDHMHFSPGAWIIRGQAEDNRLFWVQSGRVELFQPRVEGGQDYMASIGVGEHFGSMGRLGISNNLNARAVEDTRVLSLDVEALEHVLALEGDGGEKVKENLNLAVFLDGIPEMAGLGSSARLSLAGSVDIHEFEEGQHVVEEGQAADSLFLIQSGQCVVWRSLENGEEQVLAKLGPGQTFGEIGLLFEKPRSATVTCLEPSTLVEVSRVALNSALRQSFHVGLALEKLANFRLEGAS